jgi:hypothetical protein
MKKKKIDAKTDVDLECADHRTQSLVDVFDPVLFSLWVVYVPVRMEETCEPVEFIYNNHPKGNGGREKGLLTGLRTRVARCMWDAVQ